MSIVKFFACAAVAAVTTGVIADAGPTVGYLTIEKEYYADGTEVPDGEWYACCWTAEAFEGIDTDYTPVNKENGDVVLKLVRSKWDGDALFVSFGINTKDAKTYGKYCIVLLDTRDESGNPSVDSDGNGIPDRPLKAAIASAKYLALSATKAGTKTDVAGAGWDATSKPVPSTPAKIIAINPSADGENVDFKIGDACPGYRYDLIAGAEPGKLDKKYVANEPASGEGEVSISAPKGETKFYKLTTAPLAK